MTSLYDLTDSAYDAKEIRACSKQLGHVPIIDPNPRTRARKLALEAEARARRVANRLPADRQRLQERTNVERVNGRLKDECGGRRIHVRGPVKVMAHLMFGICVLSIDQLIRLLHGTRLPHPSRHAPATGPPSRSAQAPQSQPQPGFPKVRGRSGPRIRGSNERPGPGLPHPTRNIREFCKSIYRSPIMLSEGFGLELNSNSKLQNRLIETNCAPQAGLGTLCGSWAAVPMGA